MKPVRRNPFALLGAWILVAFGSPQTAQSAEPPSHPSASAALAGTVSNAATGRMLEGARVVLRGANRETLTDEQGIFRFSDLAAGVETVIVSYIGLDQQEIPIQIVPGATNRVEVGLTSGVYVMGKFVVSSEREGNALAITLQRDSVGIRNVVSSDAFGDLSGNPADLLMRLPGVVGESVGGDMRYVRIRGMNSLLSTVTSDGNRMADAASAGATREYQFQQINSDTIERIEVIKSPTPDMDADSIGGAVNMVSKSAFDRSPQRRINYSIGTTWRIFDDRDDPHPNFSFSYTETFKDKIGIAFNYSYREHTSLIDRTLQAHQLTQNEAAFTHRFEFHDSRNTRTRWGGGLKIDYKLNEHTRFYLNNTLNRHTEYSNTNIAVMATAQTVATLDANGNPTGTGAILPGFTRDMTEWRPLAASFVSLSGVAGAKFGETLHSQIGGVHRYDGLEIDYNLYRSNSIAEYGEPKAPVGNHTLTARGIGLRIERRGDLYFPYITQTAGPDMTKIESYTENIYTITRMWGEDEYLGASLNVKKRIWPRVYIKGGLRVRQQDRDLGSTPFRTRYVGPDGVEGVNPATGVNDDNLFQFLNPNVVSPVAGGRYPVLPYPARPFRDHRGSAYDYSGYNVNTALQSRPDLFSNLPTDVAFNTMSALTGRQNFSEQVSAAYLVGQVGWGKLSVVGGARFEKTETEGEGALQQITPEEAARRAAWVGPVTAEEQQRRTYAEYSGRMKATGEYSDVFPGLHLTYRPLRNLLGRFSYATNIGRPSIGQLIPRTTVNHVNLTVSTNNPSLLPQRAENFDLSLEYYFEPVGLLSAGVFLKDIEDFIFTAGGQPIGAGPDNGFDGEYAGYTLTTQRNGGFAKIKGIELAYQQQFTFLPSWWSGFGIFANYTKLKTEGDYGANVVRATGEVPGFTPETGNLGVSYIRRGVSVRLQFNYISKFLVTFNANQAALLYRRARPTVDLKTRITLSRRFDVYFDVGNFLSEPDRAQVFSTGRPNDMFKMSPQFSFGVHGRL